MRRSRGFDKGLLLLVLILIIIGATTVFLYEQIRTDRVAETLHKGEPLKIAFFVSDKDTVLFTDVLVYNPATSKSALFDIPGDVGSLIETEKKIDRIDVLFKRNNVVPYRAKIGSLLGTEIPFSIDIDMSDLPHLVDLVGGVTLFVANPVEQTNVNPMVLLPSGTFALDGSKAQSYLTYRDTTESEIEVIGREQRFLQALVKAIGVNAPMLHNGQVFSYFRSYLNTAMNQRSLLSVVDAMGKLDTERMLFQRVLGVRRTVDNHSLLFPHYDGKLLRETWAQTLLSLANVESNGERPSTTRVQILNGTLVSGMAKRTAEIYQSFGYDVSQVGNADRQDYEKTLVIDRRGDLTQAQRIASVIRCNEIESRPLPSAGATSTDGVDVTIILGKDFDGRYCK